MPELLLSNEGVNVGVVVTDSPPTFIGNYNPALIRQALDLLRTLRKSSQSVEFATSDIPGTDLKVLLVRFYDPEKKDNNVWVAVAPRDEEAPE
jgi:hypothetical protein